MKSVDLYVKMQCLLKDETGVTATEYALIASLLAIVIIVAVSATGVNLSALYDSIANALSSWQG